MTPPSDSSVFEYLPLRLAELALDFGRVSRATLHQDGVTPESDTTHTVMLGLVATELGAGWLDAGKIAQFALIHDLVEVYAGDTNTFGKSYDVAEKAAREKAAMGLLRERFRDSKWLLRTLDAYESQVVAEARWVRYMDKVLPKLTHILNGGVGMHRAGVQTRAEVAQIHRAQGAALREQYPELPEANAIFEEACRLSEVFFAEGTVSTEIPSSVPAEVWVLGTQPYDSHEPATIIGAYLSKGTALAAAAEHWEALLVTDDERDERNDEGRGESVIVLEEDGAITDEGHVIVGHLRKVAVTP